MKKPMRYGILFVCLVLVLLWVWGSIKKNKEEGGSNAMVKTFHSSYRFSSNVYVVHSEKGTILIDPGYYDSGIKKYLVENGGLDAILLTHGHWDHIYDLDSLKADFPEAPVYIFEEDIDFLANSHLNCAETHGSRLILSSKAEAITEGELDIGEYHIQVIHTPGHTRGSAMYYFTDENLLFTGDTILEAVTGPTFRPTGSDQDMKNSVKRFKALGYAGDTPLYPGHGNATTYEYVLNHNYHGGDRAYAELPTESNHWIHVNGEEAVWTSNMRLLYRCEKRNGIWKIFNMTSIFEMDKLAPVIPGTDLHVNQEDLKGLRRSYRWLSYVRIQAGGTVSHDLLGIDRPKEVQKIYEENEAWILETSKS